MKTTRPLSDAVRVDTPALARIADETGCRRRCDQAADGHPLEIVKRGGLAPITGESVSEFIEQVMRENPASHPPHIRRLLTGFQAHIKEGRAGTLERHLGLNVAQYKGRSAVGRRVMEKRWSALGAAYAAQIDCNDKTPFRRCTILLEDLKEFKKTFWPDWRRNGLPESPSLLRRAFFDILVAYDGVLPKEPRYIYQTLQRAKIIGSASDSRE